MQNNILIAGLFFSGSSAVYDLLSEYDNISIMPGEFDDFRRKGLLGDHLEGEISNANPCMLNQYVNSRLHYKYVWCNKRIPSYSQLFMRRFLLSLKSFTRPSKKEKIRIDKKRFDTIKWLKKELDQCSSNEDRIRVSNEYLQKIKKIYSLNKSYVVFDQPVFAAQHEKIWPKFFDPFKLIVVYRDPRDQIAQLIKLNLIGFDRETPTRGVIELFGSGRKGAIRYELATLNARYENFIKLQSELGENNVKIIRFESLITNYDVEKRGIEEFLGLEAGRHVYKKEKLVPEESRKNIGLYKSFLTEDELGLFDGFSDMFFNDNA